MNPRLDTGSIYGHPDSAIPSVDRIRADHDSVYLGAWGGSTRLTPSSISTDWGLPVTDETISLGLVPDSAADDAVTGRLVETLFFRRVDDTISVADPRRGNLVVEFDQAYTDWIQLFGPQAKEVDPERAVEDGDEKPVKIQGLMSFTAREVVVPNVTFTSTLACRGEQHHLGMLIESLRRWASDPYIGGCRRLGMGRVEIHARMNGEDLFEVVGGEVQVCQDHAEAVKAHAAAMERISALAAGDIEEWFRPEEKTAKALLNKLTGEAAKVFERLYL